MSTPDRGPDALLPVWAARLLGFAALASLGALQWQRMVFGLSSGRALLWVAAATAACSRQADSTSNGPIRYPAAMITSSARPSYQT